MFYNWLCRGWLTPCACGLPCTRPILFFSQESFWTTFLVISAGFLAIQGRRKTFFRYSSPSGIRSAENAKNVTLIPPASLLVLRYLRDPWYFREPVSQKRNIRSSVVPRNDYHPVQHPGENFLLFPHHHSRIPSTEYRLPNTELRIPFSPNPRLRLSHLRAIMRSTFGLTHPHQDDKLIFLSPYPTS